MKHLKLFFALFAMLALGVGNAWGAETATLSISSGVTANKTLTDDGGNSWSVTSDGSYTSNAKYIQVGTNSKSVTYLKLSTSAFSTKSISKIQVWATSKASTKVTTKVYVGGNLLGTSSAYTSQTAASGGTEFSVTNPNNYTGDILIEISRPSAANGAIYFNKAIVTYSEPGTVEKVLSSIEISGDLDNKTYEEGEELDFAGLTVTAKYDDTSEEDVTEDVEWSYTPALTKDLTSVEVSATYEDKTATKTINGLTVNEHIVTPGAYDITLNNVFFGTTANANITGPVTGKQNDITITINGTGSTKPRTDATYTRFYASSTMAISVPSGYVIKSIAITKNESDYAAPSVNVGTFNTSTKTWTGTANSVTMSFSAKSFINSIKVTYVADVKYALNITTPSNGTLVVKDGENVLTSGAEIYEGTKLTVTATPETGYEEGVVVVKNASDEDVTATVYADGVLTMPAYAVTISATFAKKPCELLAKPTVSATTTYSSATLTWGAVTNAAKYSVKVGTAEAVVTTETSYEVTGLTAETEYAYQVQAIAEAEQDTYCDSEVAEGSFTTSAAPVVTLTLKDIAGTTTKTGALNSTITLPDDAATCTKTFVGWDADENCNHAPTYAPGAEYTLTAENQTLYAVYADGEGGGNFTITKTMSEIVSDNGYTVSSGSTATCYTSLTLDENITLSTTGSANCGSFWSDPREWRLYQNKSGNAIVTATNGCSLTSVKFTFSYSNTGTLLNNGAAMKSGTAVSASGTSATYTVGNSGSATNGQIRITAIEVSYSKEGEYSNYSTTCAAAAVATVNPTSVTATAAGAEGTVTVTYENVNTANVAVALYNDAACTDAFTAGWLTASIDADENITYTVAENTTYAERKAYIQLTAPETTGAVDPAVVVIPVTQAAKEKVFASLAELLANITPTADATKVTVTLTKEPIVDIYVSGNYRNGIFLNVPYQGTTKEIEIYSRDVPAEWVAGGSVSGTLTNCDWKVYNGTWELCPADWSELTYQEPKAVSTVVVSGAPTKTTYVDGEAFDPAGLTVTVNYNDETTEVNPTGVTFTVTPTTLVKGQTSVSVTATFNSVTSEAYTVNNLTVTDIQSMTILDFITSGGTRCYLEGIVSNITNTTYGNFDLTDATGTIYVYGCLNDAGESQKFADLGVKNGDKIKVIADQYKVYGGKDQATDVQYVSHISAASITVENITMEVDEVATITATVDPADAVVTYTIKENEANAISLSGNTITALAEGTATITATVAEGATYLGNSVDFTVTVSPKAEKVVILAQLEGQWYAMTGAYVTDKTNVLAAIPVEYFNGTLYNVEEADKASIEWQRSMNGNKATFKNGDKYLTGGTSTDLTLKADAFEWDYNGVNYLCNDGKRTFLYCENMKNNVFGFKNFAISNAGSVKNNSDGTTESYSSFPTVTAPVYATGDVIYTREGLTNGKFGTICLPYGSTEYSGATFFEIAYQETGKVYIDEVTTLEAGVPYIFQANSSTLTVTCEGEAVADASSANGLYGTFTKIADVAAVHTDKDEYILTGGLIRKCELNCNVPANRAYIVLEEISTEQTPAPVNRRRVGMSVQGENETTGVEDIFTTESPAKVIENGQLIIIRGGVKYNVQGQKL